MPCVHVHVHVKSKADTLLDISSCFYYPGPIVNSPPPHKYVFTLYLTGAAATAFTYDILSFFLSFLHCVQDKVITRKTVY